MPKFFAFLPKFITQFTLSEFTNIRLSPCPHCHSVGHLMKHGFLYGNSPESPVGKIKRARRIYCSNRGQKSGCGKTHGIYLISIIPFFSVFAKLLENIIHLLLLNFTRYKIAKTLKIPLYIVYRIHGYLVRHGFHFRSNLKPPLPHKNDHQSQITPLQQTLKNLFIEFGDSPIEGFQMKTQKPFLNSIFLKC